MWADICYKIKFLDISGTIDGEMGIQKFECIKVEVAVFHTDFHITHVRLVLQFSHQPCARICNHRIGVSVHLPHESSTSL